MDEQESGRERLARVARMQWEATVMTLVSALMVKMGVDHLEVTAEELFQAPEITAWHDFQGDRLIFTRHPEPTDPPSLEARNAD